ncbi:cholinephosphotransferase 1 isoform X2 [Hyperolius riggenbachi]|uniref:cholinephosphotransferase 1 isoform X2 n=1 Tax=Hyperolius riggenbachi TaxID=752182 RepID=UPI0035A2F3DC
MVAVLCLPEPLTALQLKRLEEHKYSATGRSLSEHLMQIYWNWLVEKLPLWLAPNTITMVGLVLNVLTTVILACYCPTATEEAPAWALLLCAIGLFVYQSLDAVDGKQARRTNSSSPLGELFDHGCDSISIVFVALGTVVAVRLGTMPSWMFFCCFISMFMFFCAQWQAYVSGTLRFGMIDVTELQLSVVAVFLLSAFFGSTFWDIQIPVTGLPLKVFPLMGIILGTIYSCNNYFRVILSGGVGKNGSTVALAHMTKSELYLQDTAFIGPGLLFLDQYFNSFIDEYIVLWVALVISLFELMRYCIGVCLQIATHLRISVFSIPPIPAAEQVQVIPSGTHQNNID